MGTTVTNKNGIEFDIDALATDVNGKMDKDGVNATCPVVISRTPNEQGGVVEIWSDGYCVQTGISPNSSSATISLSQAYKDNNYLIFANIRNATNNSATYCFQPRTMNADSFTYYQTYSSNSSSGKSGSYWNWRTEGYIR